MIAGDRMVALADAFAACALDRSRWLPALDMLADATGSSHGQLVGIGGPSLVPFNWAPGVSQHALDEFVEIGGGSPKVNFRVAASIGAAPMELCAEEHYRAAEPQLVTDAYMDFASTYDIPNGCQTKLLESNEGFIGLALLRSTADGVTSTEDRLIFAEAARHARSAVRIGRGLDEDAPLLLAGTLGQMRAAAFVCDGQGRVEGMTPAAEQLLLLNRVRLTGNRMLDTADPIESALLERAIADVRRRGVLGGPAAVAFRSQPGLPLLLFDVFAIPRGRWGFESDPRILVIARAGRGVDNGMPLLRALYGLTEAEAEVALRTARGETRDRVAAQRDASLETVRSQLKAIYAKLGITRELELARMLGPLV